MPVKTSDWVGLTLDRRYRVVALLGEGGMGYVLRARDSRLGCDVVLKVPRPEMLADAEFRDRFRAEVVALVKLAHPHIVKVSDYCQHEGTPFAVMQFLSGGSLDDRRPRDDAKRPKPVSPRTLGEWLRPIADALDFIHHQGYIHRDVKPANILFDAHKHPYLSDFGVAKALASGQIDRKGLTGVGMVIGTPEYMAPELVMGESADGRIDQYALAITVYEVLCGHVPFTGPTGPAVLVKQTSETAPPLCEIRPSVSKALADAVARGMAKKPGERFANCVAFADAVIVGIDQPAAKPAKPTPPAMPAKASAETPRATSTAPIAAAFKVAPARSRRGLFAIAGGAVILLAATALGVWLLNRPASPSPSQPETSQQLAANDPKPPVPIPDIVKPPPEPPKINTKPGRPNQNKAGGKGKNQSTPVIAPPPPVTPPTKIDAVRIMPGNVNLIAGGTKQEVSVEVDRTGTGAITVELQSNAGVTITPSNRSLAVGTNEARFEITATGQLKSQSGELTVSVRGDDSPRIERIPVTVTRLDFRVNPTSAVELQMQPGDVRDVKLTIDRSGGYRGAIQISSEGSSAVEPSSVTLLGRDEVSATMRIRAKRGATVGESSVTIKGTATELSVVNLATIAIRVYRPPVLVATLGKSSAPITAVAIHGNYDGVLKILTGGADGSVQNWYRPEPKRHPNEFKWGWSQTEHKKSVASLAFSPDGRQAVSGSMDGTVALWDTHTRNEVIRKFNGNGEWHKTGVWHVYFQPRGPLNAQFGLGQSVQLDNPAPVSISDDAGILWDETSAGAGGAPKSFAVGGRQRAAQFGPASGQSTLRNANTRLGQPNAESYELAGLTGDAFEVYRQGQLVNRMPKSGTVIRSMSLSADGNRAMTLGADGQLRLWDVRSRSLHAGFPWKPDGDEIGAAGLSGDGLRLLIGNSNGTLKLWRLP